MDDKQRKNILDEVIKIWSDYPELPYLEVIEKAREMMKNEEKGLC